MTIEEVLQKEYRKRIKADAMSIGDNYDAWSEMESILKQITLGNVHNSKLLSALKINYICKGREFQEDTYANIVNLNSGVIKKQMDSIFSGENKDALNRIKETTDRVIVLDTIMIMKYGNRSIVHGELHNDYNTSRWNLNRLCNGSSNLTFYTICNMVLNDKYEVIDNMCGAQASINNTDIKTNGYWGVGYLNEKIESGSLFTELIKLIERGVE